MDNATPLANSLHVPSVQELANQSLTTVPPRYVRFSDHSSPLISDSNNVPSSPQIPVIDMESLISQESMDMELEKLRRACQQWGFFQLINHGVNSSLIEEVKKGVNELFDLPMEEKKKFWQKEGDIQGFGQAFVSSEEQKLDWGDMFTMITLPTHLRPPHLLPQFPHPLRGIVEAYSGETKNLAIKLLNLIAKALSIRPDEMEDLFEDGFQSMRMNYYPPCPRPELVIGLSSHSDADGITILLQVNETEGLQVKKDEVWIPVKPLPSAFIINIGDMLEIFTNGKCRSIDHRSTINSDRERVSIATFYSPNMQKEVGPASSLITPQTPALFKRIGVADYFRSYLARELNGKSLLDIVRIQNDDAKEN